MRNLRPEFSIGPPQPELVVRLMRLAESAVSALERGEACAGTLAEIAKLAGTDAYDAAFFRSLPGVMSSAEFAGRAAMGEPPLVEDLTREDVAALIARASDAENPFQDYYLRALEKNLPNAAVSDLIYWPDRARSVDEMADEALKRHALFHKGGVAAVQAYLDDIARGVLDEPNPAPWALRWARSRLG